ncbi:MAG: hypothetical protein ACRDSJ_21665 [Rubrobacteraceae bacterium]
MSEPEFYANATLGFRKWHFSLRDGENEPLLLEGLYKYNFHEPLCRWDLLNANHAECLRLKFNPNFSPEGHDEVPEPGCGCGFYAYGRRDDSNSETTVQMVGGVVAGWGNLELHERGFKCGIARILALFAPSPCKSPPCDNPYYKQLAARKWLALWRMCADNDIPLLQPDALRDDDEVRRYAREWDLALLEDQLNFGEIPAA